MTRDPEAAMRGLTTDETLPGLTPAQKTGDEGLLSLERSVIESSEQLKGQSDEQIANMTQVIRESLSRPGEGVSPERTAQAMEAAQGHLRGLLDTRLRVAARIADEKIAALGPNATRADANLIARDELTKALTDARTQERELWRAVPMEAETSTRKAKSAYQRLLKETPRAQQSDIPAVARELLEAESNTALGDVDRVRELHGLRSKLLEDARNARSTGQRNKARIADEIADAILDDLGAAAGNVKGETGETLRAALNYSADLNGRFTRGPVGRLLGTARQGGAATPLELTLERTVGRGGPVGRVESQALQDAVSRTGDLPALRGSVEDFLKDEFQRNAVRNGEISPAAARVFVNKYQDTLEDFPDLRRQFDQAIESGNAETVARKRAEGVAARLNDPKVSRSAIFIQHPPEQVIQQIAKVRRPGDAMKELVKLADRDTTGDALKGIKTTFTDYLMNQASTKTMTAEGQSVISGFALRRLLESGPTRKMADALFSPDERRFLQIVANTAEKVEKAVAVRPRPEGIIADRPAMLTNVIAGVTGAQLGRKVAEATGGGTVQTPGIMAGIFRRLTASRIQDPARRLLIDAVQDEDLFKALIAKTTDPKQQEFARRKLNAWAVAVIRDAGGEDTEE
ncbi:MAG: hypothetical protein GEU76_03940 [Alphaproteobacteria bacterium]|nr:hypothetical protein [Alphaproteobacteria bacterium]